MHEATRLRHLRHGVDLVDDAMLCALAGRRWLVRRLARAKRAEGRPGPDARREAAIRARADTVGRRLGLPPEATRRLIAHLIADGRAAQGIADDVDQGTGAAGTDIIPRMMETSSSAPPHARWLRLVPPPERIAPLARRLPRAWRQAAFARAVAGVLSGPAAQGTLDFMRGRRLGIDVTDLGLQWTLTLEGDRLVVVDDAPEASVRGTATDLMRMAARLDDPDTLFFQRRLVLTGDTELALTARNVLDRLPWEQVPLALRIVLNRAARFAGAAREAHRARGTSAADRAGRA